jgi:hypothetical protein
MDNNTHEVPITGLTYKWFDIMVTAADQVYTVTYELDKTIAFITGIGLDTNREKLLYQRGSQKIEINRQEIVPEGFLSKRMYHLPTIEAHKRFLRRGGRIPVGNGIIKVEYKDTSDALAPFEPYWIRVNLDCVLKDF